MTQNFVTYQVALIPENAELINRLNEILIPGASVSASTASTSSTSSTTAETTQAAETETEETTLTTADLKAAAKQVKADHGEEFALQCMVDIGVKTTKTLGGCLKNVPEEAYTTLIGLWEMGPQPSDEPEDDLDDGLGDDDLDDGLDEPDVDAEAVKTALKAYAKTQGRPEAKKLMTDHGINALSEVDDMEPAAMAKLFKACDH